MPIVSARYAPPSVYSPQPPDVEPPVLVLATDDTGFVNAIAMDDPNTEWQNYLAAGGIIKPNTEPTVRPSGLVNGPTLSEVFRT